MKKFLLAALMVLICSPVFAQDIQTSKLTITRADTAVGALFLMIPVVNGEVKEPLARGGSATYEVPMGEVAIEFSLQGQRKGMGRLVIGNMTKVSEAEHGITIQATDDRHLVEYKPGYGDNFRQIF